MECGGAACRQSTQDLVKAWRQQNLENLVNHGDQAICCVPYRCTQRVSDCYARKFSKKKRGGELHYVPIKVDGTVYHSPKPKFMNCVNCVVWEFIEAHEEEFCDR